MRELIFINFCCVVCAILRFLGNGNIIPAPVKVHRRGYYIGYKLFFVVCRY